MSSAAVAAEPAAATAAAARPEPTRYAFIDALRGFAAMYVLLYHFHNELTAGGRIQRLPGALHAFLTHGDLGVQIFFVLSGFVISLSVHGHTVTPGYIGRFALRRSLRLDPVYWVVIAAMYAVLLVGHGPPGNQTGHAEWQVLLGNMFYMDRLLGLPTIVLVGWTLCLEFQFYLVFISVLGVAQKLGTWVREVGKWLVFGPLLLWSLAVFCRLLPLPTPGLFIDAWCLFFLGVTASWLTRGAPRAWLVVFVLAAATFFVRFDWAMVVALGTSLLILGVGDARRRTWLNVRPLQYLGRVSYSLYLVHPLVGHRITRWGVRRFGNPPPPLESVGLFVAAVVASFVAAHLLHVFVEQPALRLARRVSLGRRAPAVG